MEVFVLLRFNAIPILSKDKCSKTCMGSFSVLTPSSLPFRNTTLFPLLRNQIFIVTPSIPRKIVGVLSFVNRREISSSVSNIVGDKDAGSLN